MTNTEAGLMLRGLLTTPDAIQLIGSDCRARSFRSNLRKLILLRDTIRWIPYCEAQIQEVDHITAHRDGETTTWDNATALCGV